MYAVPAWSCIVHVAMTVVAVEEVMRSDRKYSPPAGSERYHSMAEKPDGRHAKPCVSRTHTSAACIITSAAKPSMTERVSPNWPACAASSDTSTQRASSASLVTEVASRSPCRSGPWKRVSPLYIC